MAQQLPPGTFVVGAPGQAGPAQCNPVAAPAQAVTYVQTAPAYVSMAPPIEPSKPEKMVGNAIRIGNSLGNAASNFVAATLNAALTGKSGAVSAATGKVNYVLNMARAGGPGRYWQQMFTPPQWDALIDTFACELKMPVHNVPGIIFLSKGAISFCADQQSGSGYLRVVLPFSRIQLIQPGAGTGGQGWVGVVMIDGNQFWFTCFNSFTEAARAITAAGAAAHSVRNSLSQSAQLCAQQPATVVNVTVGFPSPPGVAGPPPAAREVTTGPGPRQPQTHTK